MSKRIFELAGIIAVDGMTMAIAGLKELDTQFKAAEKSFFKFGRQLSSAGAKLSTNVTLPIVGMAGAATLAAKKFGDLADKLFDMQAITGLSTDSLQEYQQVARDAGTDFDGFIASVQKLTLHMPQIVQGTGESSKALRELGVGVFDADGKIRDINILFPEIIKKLQNVENATQRTAIAQQIFGRSMNDLGPVLGMTNAEFDKSIKKAHDLNLIVGQEGLKAADDFRAELETTTAQVTALGYAALADVLPVFRDTLFPLFRDSILPALKDMAMKVADVARWFNELDGGTKRMIVGLVGFAAAAGPVILIAGKMIGAIAGVSAAVKTLRLAMLGFSMFMATNPLGIAVVALGLLTAAIFGTVAAMDAAKRKKQELAADKSYSASAEEERRDNEENIRLWQERVNWLERQHKPTASMIQEMEDLRQAIKDTNAVLGKGPAVQLADPEAEAARKKALDEARKKREEIEKVNADYDKRLFDATLHSDEERFQRERTLTLEYVKKTGGDVALAAEALDAEHTAKLREQENERLRIKREAAEEAANREKEWTNKLIEQSGDKLAIIENEKQAAIKAAGGKEAEIAKIEAYYREEKRKAEKEIAKESQESFIDKANKWLAMIGNIGSGIAGLFQQSTANKQIALDNQQQAERDAIEGSTKLEKEKRKALAELDKKQDAQQRAFRKKAAAESKKIGIFESIMGTASAVIAALGAAPWSLLNFVYAGIVGGIGAAKTALIAAQPLPLAEGAYVQGGRGGTLAQIGEGRQSELVLPVDTGVKMLARRLLSTMRDFVPAPLAMAGAGGGYGGGGSVSYHIGTFIGDDRGIKEFERRQLSIRNNEAQRKGQMA